MEGDMSEKADESVLKTDALIEREGAIPSIPTNHPKYNKNDYLFYGPYLRKEDNRRHLIIINIYSKERKTISYSKFLLECKLNRLLLDNEETHHKNENEWDDNLENLEVINLTKHREIHSKKAEKFICP